MMRNLAATAVILLGFPLLALAEERDNTPMPGVPTRIVPPAPATARPVVQESAAEATPSDDAETEVARQPIERYIPRARGHSHYGYFSGRRVVPPHGAGYGVPYGLYGRWQADAYYAGRQDEYELQRRNANRRGMAGRKARALSKHELALYQGLDELKAGAPDRAVISLTLAARLNQADPACRIHLAQARLALGHYTEAAFALQRALELQPMLLYHHLALETYYPSPDTLDRSVADLSSRLRQERMRPEVWMLLGYLEYQRGDFSAAYEALTIAAKQMPNDDRVRDLLSITRPAGAP